MVGQYSQKHQNQIDVRDSTGSWRSRPTAISDQVTSAHISVTSTHIGDFGPGCSKCPRPTFPFPSGSFGPRLAKWVVDQNYYFISGVNWTNRLKNQLLPFWVTGEKSGPRSLGRDNQSGPRSHVTLLQAPYPTRQSRVT